MKHPFFSVSWLSLVLVLLAGIHGSFAAEGSKPNIIVILADDQGYGDVSALNPESKIPTPNIDRLATEGMIFTDAHTSSSVCTPTRYSLLTGRYHWRTRLQDGVLGGFSRPLISPDTETIAGLLRENGYHTACVGKWHLGMDWPMKGGGVADDQGNFGKGAFPEGWNVDYSGSISHGPTARGFDYFFGISASLDMPPYVYIENDRATEPASVEKSFPRPGPAGENFEAVDVLPRITEVAVNYIGERAANAKTGEQPFFLYFPLNAPHTPIVPTGEWEGKSGINKYADFTMQVDDTVRQVLEALDQQGLTENTLIIFTTDNGCSPAANIPELQKAGHEPSYIYRGHKADIFEGGHRVPFLARWPGKVPAGSRCDQLVSQIDLFATAADLAGTELPEDQGVDSVSILSALLGQDDPAAPLREALVHQSIRGSFAIRKGDWKLNLCPGSGGWSPPRPGKDDLSGLPEYQLYNLTDDPGETRNLQGEKPEKVSELEGLLKSWIERGRSTPGPDQQNAVAIDLVKPLPAAPAPKKAPRKGA